MNFFFVTVKKAIELKSRGVKMLPNKDSNHKNSVCKLKNIIIIVLVKLHEYCVIIVRVKSFLSQMLLKWNLLRHLEILLWVKQPGTSRKVKVSFDKTCKMSQGKDCASLLNYLKC